MKSINFSLGFLSVVLIHPIIGAKIFLGFIKKTREAANGSYFNLV
jgi:hypothetical protein